MLTQKQKYLRDLGFPTEITFDPEMTEDERRRKIKHYNLFKIHQDAHFIVPGILNKGKRAYTRSRQLRICKWYKERKLNEQTSPCLEPAT